MSEKTSKQTTNKQEGSACREEQVCHRAKGQELRTDDHVFLPICDGGGATIHSVPRWKLRKRGICGGKNSRLV